MDTGDNEELNCIGDSSKGSLNSTVLSRVKITPEKAAGECCGKQVLETMPCGRIRYCCGSDA
jgi:hypothetical protein